MLNALRRTLAMATHLDTDTLYLVVLTHPEHAPRGLFIEAPTWKIADAKGRYQYATLTGCASDACSCRVTAYADLPEIMFGEECDSITRHPADR
jgi:hypothetical protein